MRILRAVLLSLGLLAAMPARAEPVLFVQEPLVLEALEARGYGFEQIFSAGRGDLDSLYMQAPAYHAIVDTIGSDIGEIAETMKADGRPLTEFAALETGRVMDMRWLKTSAARMRLVGVVDRLDRRDFHAVRGEGGCGEMRLIYRLAYRFQKDGKGKVLSSRMPFNFNAVFDILPDADGGCTGVAARWTPGIDELADAGWLAGGPLDRAGLKFRQLELNAQVVRFPSGQEPQFGGQAVYLMRIFGIDGDTAVALPLENTPDTEALESDADLKARLADYIRDNAAAIDQGVYRIPDELLATKAISFSTFGNARETNHPLTRLFSPRVFADLDLSAGRLVRSPEALIERLDNGTCQGCHQSGATAGFHVLGLDDKWTSPLNRIEVGISPHLHAELPRRKAYVEAVATDREPNRFRPLSFAPPASWDGQGGVTYEAADDTMPCIAEGDAGKFGAGWQCGAGTVCTPLAAASSSRSLTLAQCLLPDDSKAMFSGHPCLAGTIAPDAEQPFRDKYTLKQFTAFAAKASAADYTCRPPRIGVPGGLAYRRCDERDRAFASYKPGAAMPNEVCGLTGGKQFDLCVASGNFDQCLAGAVQRGNRQSCSADHFCRDDYICQAFPPDTPNVKKIKGVGFCSPTYFMFQMRIDNHATPWSKGRARPEETYRSVEVEGDPDDLW